MNKQAKRGAYISFFVTLFLILFSGFRGFTVDRDHGTYVHSYFDAAQPLSSYLNGTAHFVHEPFINIVSSILKYNLGSGPMWLFVVFAVLAISIKSYVMIRDTEDFLLAMLVYVSLYYFVEDFTQIRAGLADSFLLFGFGYLYKGKRLKYFFFALLACSVHYGALVSLPLVFLRGRKIRPIYVYILIALIVLALVDYRTHILTDFAVQHVFSRVAYYLKQKARPDLLNPLVWVRVGFAFWLYYRSRRASEVSAKLSIMTKIYFISLFLYFFFAFNATFSTRLREMLGVIEIVLVPTAVREFRATWMQQLIIVGALLSGFVGYMFVIKLVQPYYVLSVSRF